MKILILLLIGALVSGCSEIKKDLVYTPERNRSIVHVTPKEYYMDSVRIHDDIMLMVKKSEEDFDSYKFPYIDTTKSEVLIDTILYDSSRTKKFILLAVKAFDLEYYRADINGKEVEPNQRFLYDGFAVFTKNTTPHRYETYYIHPTNYDSVTECLERLQEIYFHELGPIQRKGYNRYNVDDKRMWMEPIWDKL